MVKRSLILAGVLLAGSIVFAGGCKNESQQEPVGPKKDASEAAQSGAKDRTPGAGPSTIGGEAGK